MSRSTFPGEGSIAGRLRACKSILLAFALITAIWLIAVSRWYLTDTTVPWDAKNQFFAFFRFLAESLHAGTTIFWNPYHYGGHPSIADPQSLVFSPPFLLWAWFDRTPSLRSFDLILMGHLLAGGLAMAALGSRRGWTTPASVLAAALFMLGGAASARLNHAGIITSYGLFPIAMLALERAMAMRSIGWSIAFAIVGSMIAIGRNQVALMLCLLLLMFGIAQVATAQEPLRYLRARLGIIALMVLIGALLCAVPVLLSLQLAVLSNRPAISLATALEGSLHPSALASLAVPNIFGSHAPGFGYWGPHYSIMPEVGATDDTTNYLFVGTTAVVILLWLGAASGTILQRGYRLLATGLALALLFAGGRYSPLYPFVFDHVPGFAFFRRPSDAMFIASILIALICGQLLTDFTRHGLPRAHLLGRLVVVAASLGILAWALSVAAMTGHAYQAALEILRVLPVAAVAALALYLPRTISERAAAGMVLAFMAVAELVIWNAASRMNAEARSYYGVLEQAVEADADALRLLDQELQRRHLEGSRPRIEILGLGGPWQNLSVVRRFEATTGYNPLRIGIYDKYVSPGESPASAEGRRFPATFADYSCALARAIGLEYVVLDRPIEQVKQMKRPERAEVLLAGPKVWIYRLHGARPRVVFSSHVKVADLDATLLSGELRNPPSADGVVVDDETPPTRKSWPAPTGRASGSARVTSWQPGRIEINVEASAPGILVLHDTYYPGWVAEVDGRRQRVLRVEVLFRGVEVGPGRHTVVFKFEPLSFANLASAARQVLMRR